MATAPLTRVISGLTGVHDLDDPALAGLTRAARYDTLLGLAAANLRAEGRWCWSHPLVPNGPGHPPGLTPRVAWRPNPP